MKMMTALNGKLKYFILEFIFQEIFSHFLGGKKVGSTFAK